MGKDTTAFRERFNAYKNGKSVSEIYDAGLPRYRNGKNSVIDTLDKDLLDTLHYIHDYYRNRGMSLQDIAGIAANMFKESSFRHNAKDGAGYHGYVQMSPDMQLAVKKAYGNLDPDTQLLFVLDQITGNSKVKGYTNGAGYKYGGYKTGGDAAEAFRSKFERNKAGRQQSRIDYGNQFYDYLNQRALKLAVGQQPQPIIARPDAVAVRPTIPAEQAVPAYNPTINPYISGKPMVKLMPKVQLPNLIEAMEDSEWEPQFPGLKNGKLPRCGDGKQGNKINTSFGGIDLDETELYLVDNSQLSAVDKIATGISSGIMGFARGFGAGVNNEEDYVRTRRELGGGTAQRTYLLPRGILKRVFLDDGYIEGTPGDYGLVKSAVGNRNLPVYQTRKDAISRKNLVHLGNILDGGYDTTFIDPERRLVHAGSFPSAIYVDGSTGLLYQKAWDLNDYGGNRAGVTYDGKQWLANILDIVGSPTVVTTGYLPMNKDIHRGYYFSPYKGDWRDELLQRIINQGLAKKGLHLEEVNGKYVPMLPGIEVVYDKNTKEYHYYKDGKLPGYKNGKIHIKPANRGKFTALKKRTGHSASWFKENGTPAQKKMAVFALNAKKWKH